jgi:hypothetical protein
VEVNPYMSLIYYFIHFEMERYKERERMGADFARTIYWLWFSITTALELFVLDLGRLKIKVQMKQPSYIHTPIIISDPKLKLETKLRSTLTQNPMAKANSLWAL